MEVIGLRQALRTGLLGMLLALVAWPAWGITVYRVLVLSDTPEDLATAQTVVPDAFLAVGPERISILAGTFINQVNAQKRQAELERLGLTVTIAQGTDADDPLEPAAPAEPAAPPAPATPIPTPAPISPPTAPPQPTAPVSPTPDQVQRPFAVLVLNPTADPNLAANLRRFFPAAIEVIYQQQPALITGSFSQQAQAQQQTQWLNAQGFGAVVVSTTEISFTSISGAQPSAPTPPPSGEQVWVLVADPAGERLAPIQQLVPDAIPLIYDGLRVVKAGGYPTTTAAQTRAEQLNAQGYEVGLFPADLERTQPIFSTNGPTPTPAPAATPTPGSTPPPSPQASPIAATSEDPEISGFVVLIPQQQGSDRLGRVQTIAPDAFERRYQDQPVIQMGTYRLRQSAEQAIQELDALGLPGRIVPL